MNLISIIKGTTIEAAKPNKPFGYLPEAIQVVVKHFGFLEFPTEFSKLLPHGATDAESPAIFRHGTVNINNRDLVIDELQVFQNGIIVSTPNNTTDSDLITDYIFKWAGDHFGLEYLPIRPKTHFSQLEIQFERSLSELFSPLIEIGTAINNALDKPWESMPHYELINIHFGFDPLKAPVINTGVFRIEARAQMPLDLGIYFCEAAMTTDKHLAILTRFETICLEKFAK